MLRSQRTMADEDKPSLNKPRVEPPSAGMKERPFDLWLHKQLHAMYDEIASEPLPDDLLDLIDRDADSKKAKPPAGKK
jgi:hypothetical protein